MSNKSPHRGAIAILHQDNRFLLQLRDNFPHILFPGQWTLFGGHIEPHESPDLAIKREIWEEIGYEMVDFSFFGQYNTLEAHRYVFVARLRVSLSQLRLQEGWDMALVPPEQIESGECYSDKAGENRLLVPIHRQILLDFIHSL